MRLKDNTWLGMLAGMIGPVIGILIFYVINFRHSAFTQFFVMAARENLLSPLLSLCAIINLGVFFMFIRINHLHSARGVILSTFMYGVTIVALKFIF